MRVAVRAALAVCSALAVTPLGAQAQTPRAQFERLREDGNGLAALRDTVRVGARNLTIAQAVRRIVEGAGLALAYDPDLPGLDAPAELDPAGRTAARALLDLLRDSPLEVLVSRSGQVVLRRRGARIEGTVRDSATGAPVPGAWARVAGFDAVTGADGRFAVDLRTGPHVVLVRAIGYAPVRSDTVVVVDGAVTRVDVALAPLPVTLAEVVVTPGTFAVLGEDVSPSRQTLTRQEIETRAQIGEDLFRAINRLPGLTSNDFSAAFRVRGGANDELLVRFDGLELHEPFHLKDLDDALSVVDVTAVGGVNLVTGGSGAEFGNHLTGVLDMTSLEPPLDGPRTALGLSLTNARFMSRGRFAGDAGSWLLSARRGYLDLILDLAGGERDLHPIYWDLLGKVRFRLGQRHAVGVHTLLAGDQLTFQDDPDDPRVESDYGSWYGWVTWEAEWGRVASRTTASIGRLTWSRDGSRDSRLDGAPDLTITDRREHALGALRQDWTAPLAARTMIKWGVEVGHGSASYDYTMVERHSVVVSDSLREQTDTSTLELAPRGGAFGAYLAPRWRPLDAITVEVGLRYDHWTRPDVSEWSPRLNVAVSTDPRTTWRAAWGRYVQPQQLYALGVPDGDSTFYSAEVAEQRVIGVERVLGLGVWVRLEGYQRLLTHPRPGYVNLDGSQGPFPEVEQDRRLVAPAHGSVRGVEVFVKRGAPSRLTWSASYAYSVGRDEIGGVSVPRPMDQPHTFYLDVGYRLDHGWHLATAWQWHSGWPLTSAAFVVDTLSDGNVVITRDYPTLNDTRLPAYHRLDLRVTREIPVRRGRLWAFLDVFNVYDRANPRGSGYNVSLDRSGRFTVQRVIEELIPRVPSFGVTWEF